MPEQIDERVVGIEERLATRSGALTAPEVAELFNLSQWSIYRLAKEGTIPSFRVGSSVRFDPKRLAEWYRKHSIG